MVDGKNIARENRICPLCNNGEIGGEFHYLFKCQYFGNQRKIYLKKNIQCLYNHKLDLALPY